MAEILLLLYIFASENLSSAFKDVKDLHSWIKHAVQGTIPAISVSNKRLLTYLANLLFKLLT